MIGAQTAQPLTRNSTPSTALNIIVKEKNGSTLQSRTVFQNCSRVEPFWIHFFLSCYIMLLEWPIFIQTVWSFSFLV